MGFSGLTWRKSSYSTSNGNCVEVSLVWRKSRYSTSNCVEVGVAGANRATAVATVVTA